MRSHPNNSRSNGFTLLELVIAVALMAMIVGMVFSTARASLSIGKAIVETQDEEMLHQAFIDLLTRRFTSLPGNTRFDLQVSDSGSHYLSDLTIQNVPLSFTWGGQARIAKAVQLSTVKKRSGFLDVVLKYYENEILPDSTTSAQPQRAGDDKPFAEIVLLTDVAYFEWRVLDGRSMEWQYDWDLQGRLPLQLELTMTVGAKGEEIRQIFWIPPKQNIEVLIRQMQQSGSSGDANGNSNGNGNGGGGVTIPGGGVQIPGGGGNPPGN